VPNAARILAARAIGQIQSAAARLANLGRTAPRDYLAYSACGLLRAHRVALRIRDGEEVLDVGCGNGGLLRALAMFRSLRRAAGVDVSAPRLVPRDLSVAVYDGKRLPFADRAFDVVVFAYVLHYLTRSHAVSLLDQATRIARRRVIVIEDSLPAFSALYRVRNRLEHLKSNLLYAGPGYATAPDDQMYLTISEWVDLLGGLPKAASVDVERLDVISELVHHTLFDVTLAPSSPADTSRASSGPSPSPPPRRR
jgi:SAM-dependent methyltransferase